MRPLAVKDSELHPMLALARRARLASGWTQREIAERLGVVQSAISDLERRQTKSPGLDRVEGYMAAVGLELTARVVRRMAWTPGTLPKEFVEVLSFAAGVPIDRDSEEVERLVRVLNDYDRGQGR